jgi:hypothetical protein
MTITNHSSDDTPAAFGTMETGVVLNADGTIDSYGWIAVVDRREIIGWAKANGAGEVIFRQAGHPANDAALPADGWRPLALTSQGDLAVAHDPPHWQDDDEFSQEDWRGEVADGNTLLSYHEWRDARKADQ